MRRSRPPALHRPPAMAPARGCAAASWLSLTILAVLVSGREARHDKSGDVAGGDGTGRAPLSTVTIDIAGAGPVLGLESPGRFRQFLNIPYAGDPSGHNRWRDPVARRPWTRAVDGRSYGAICPQMNQPQGERPNW